MLNLKSDKPRKKHLRFNGMPEEEVAKRLLPDLIKDNLDILIVSSWSQLFFWSEFFKDSEGIYFFPTRVLREFWWQIKDNLGIINVN